MSVLHRLREIFGTQSRASEQDARGDHDFMIANLASLADWESYRAAQVPELERRNRVERDLMASGEKYFEIPGHCFVCDAPSRFSVSYDYAYEVDNILTPNWREHLKCHRCGLSNRMRAAIHLLEALLHPPQSARIYITEQLSPIHDRLSSFHAEVVGSEYLRDGTPCGGTNGEGVRHEDLTRLSFESERFDLLISFDVLEHVPNYRAALVECARVLRPGGALFFSVPFRIDSGKHLVRAALNDDGTIEHFLPPEYHGDPLVAEGCLAFYQFGWELLDELRELGFEDVTGYLHWSRYYAYLGRHQLIFMARKPR